MSEDQSPAPEADVPTVARTLGDLARAAGETPLLTLPEPPARFAPYATLVTTDRRIIELSETDAGGMRITVEGRGTPLDLDPFQAGALQAAIRSMGAF